MKSNEKRILLGFEILVLSVCLFAVIPMGCGKGDDSASDADTDSDTDADTDADSDSDSDSDSDADTGSDTNLYDQRIVAIGDMHADIEASMNALQIGGVIDASGNWIGGDTIVVQTGDTTDRWKQDRELLDFMFDLKVQAEAAGGQLIFLLGNHEIMNAQGDFRYVDEDSCDAFADIDEALLDMDHPSLQTEICPNSLACTKRCAAFLPGAPYANLLSQLGVTAIVEDNLFAHGGVLPKHVEYGLDNINSETSLWLQGKGEENGMAGDDSDSIAWLRDFSDGIVSDEDCDVLEETLDALGMTRLVVGHTVQMIPNSDCDGLVWRIDVGMCEYYGGITRVIEILGSSTVNILHDVH